MDVYNGFQIRDVASSHAERLLIDSNGYVGIKLTDPHLYYAKDLVVKSIDQGGITIRSTGTSDTQYLMFADGTSGNERYRGYIGYQHNTGSGGGEHMQLAASGTMMLRVDSDGLKFNADTAAANALDDYEEGTFTPAVTSGLAAGQISYNSRSGRYTKIGNVVTFTFHMNIASCSLDSGALKFGGLPKTAVNNGHLCGGCYLTMSNGNMGSDKTYRVVANSTDIQVLTAAGDAFAANSSSLNAGNRALSIHGSYYTDL